MKHDFLRRNGSLIVTTVCVAVIIGSAVWTNIMQQVDAASAVRPMQQSLAEAATPEPVNKRFAPVDPFEIIEPYNDEVLTMSAQSGIWRLHDWIEIRTTPGDSVLAATDGVVIETSETRMTLQAENGDVLIYDGLETSVSVHDSVTGGQLVGHACGNRLHIHAVHDGHAIDPEQLWQ